MKNSKMKNKTTNRADMFASNGIPEDAIMNRRFYGVTTLMKYIIVIKTSGEVEVRSYEQNTKIELEEWQSFFGGSDVECVPSIFPGIEIICNEEGKLKGLPTMRKLRYNAIATGLLHPSIADVLVGDAVLASVKKDRLDGMNEAAKEFIVKQIFEAVAEAKAEVTKE